MKKKILIHSLVFSPDGVSTAYLYNDIALGLSNNGYDVVVITTTPHYNLVKEDIDKQPLTKCWGGIYYRSRFHGITVFHVPQKKYKSFPARVAGFVFLHVMSLALGLRQKKISLIFSPSPPLTIGIVSIIIGKLKGAKIIYNVQEIYPDFLINQGNLKPGLFLTVLKNLEKWVYNYSDRVTTIDDVFYNTIISRFKEPYKLIVIPNFVDTELYRPIDKNYLGLDANIFPNKDVLKIMYAGNIGHAQDWQPLLEVAWRLRNEPVRFWVIGEGVEKKKLEKDIAKRKLENIVLLAYQPRHTMPLIVNYADLHFIFMNSQMEGQGFPSKVYTIMACKKPLLIVSGKNTPLYNFLKDKDCAVLITDTDEKAKCDKTESALQNILQDRRWLAESGSKAFEIIQKQYSKRSVIKQYVNLIDETLS